MHEVALHVRMVLSGCACHGLSKLCVDCRRTRPSTPPSRRHIFDTEPSVLQSGTLLLCHKTPSRPASISMLMSSVQGFSLTVQEQGLKGLVRGWAPTLVGYSVQGAGKFGEYTTRSDV
jgi:Mitochondrial carrier protein